MQGCGFSKTWAQKGSPGNPLVQKSKAGHLPTGPLKGPKIEIIGSGVFTQIRPVWVGDLGSRPKYPTWERFLYVHVCINFKTKYLKNEKAF
jgi:hypothetical protein